MTTINRNQFIKDLAGGHINVHDLSKEAKQELLTNLNITEKDLLEIAGKDGQISGQAEFNKLFNLVDKRDHNGSYNSIQVADDSGNQMEAGEMYEALKAEVDRNRAKAHAQGVIHVGLREASKSEADALEKANPSSDGGVVRIEGYKSKGITTYDGKTYDLKNTTGLEAYRDALINGPDKMPKDQAQKLVDFLSTQDKRVRDDLADLGLTLFRTGKGDLPMNRLVISGHGAAGGSFYTDDSSAFTIDDIKDLAKIFPDGAGKIEHVAVSACYCAGVHVLQTLRDGFPNLKSAMAYTGSSPKAEKGAPQHLVKWESMTDGDDPSRVDPVLEKSATWNVADGTQGLNKKPIKELEQDADFYKFVYDAYKNGTKDAKYAPRDRDLTAYYAAIADLINHPDLPETRRKELEVIKNEVLRLRHPELFQGGE